MMSPNDGTFEFYCYEVESLEEESLDRKSTFTFLVLAPNISMALAKAKAYSLDSRDIAYEGPPWILSIAEVGPIVGRRYFDNAVTTLLE